eukprot:2824844-Prymnesium_polylepis.1
MSPNWSTWLLLVSFLMSVYCVSSVSPSCRGTTQRGRAAAGREEAGAGERAEEAREQRERRENAEEAGEPVADLRAEGPAGAR